MPRPRPGIPGSIVVELLSAPERLGGSSSDQSAVGNARRSIEREHRSCALRILLANQASVFVVCDPRRLAVSVDDRRESPIPPVTPASPESARVYLFEETV